MSETKPNPKGEPTVKQTQTTHARPAFSPEASPYRNNLMTARLERKMSQTELSARSSVALGTLNRAEKWHFKITLESAIKLCGVLQYDVEAIFPYLHE